MRRSISVKCTISRYKATDSKFYLTDFPAVVFDNNNKQVEHDDIIKDLVKYYNDLERKLKKK